MARRRVRASRGCVDLRGHFPRRVRPLPRRSKPEHEVSPVQRRTGAIDTDRLDHIVRLVAQTRSVGEDERHAADGDGACQDVTGGSGEWRGDRRLVLY